MCLHAELIAAYGWGWVALGCKCGGSVWRAARQVLKVEHVVKILILNGIQIHGRTELGVECVLARTVDAGGTRLTRIGDGG